MIYREIEEKLNKWIVTDNHKGLLISGVRQSGKTYIIRECLKKSSVDYVEFNLINETQVVKVLNSESSIDEIILRLSLLCGKNITPYKTILFFDEIQECKEIVSKMKFFVENGKYKIVMSGSLLGVELVDLKSAPVGYLESIEMYPLSFKEFLIYMSETEGIINTLRESFINQKPVDEVIHNKVLEYYHLYMIIGGMPSVVENFKKNKNIDDVINEHKELVKLYKMDFTKNEEQNKKLILRYTYDLIPAELNDQNKRFKISDIQGLKRTTEIQDTFLWLVASGVALPTYNIAEPKYPLLINKKRNLVKLFLSDIGILTSLYGKSVKSQIMEDAKDINKGAVYENVVCQELVAKGIVPYYYNSKSKGELDFVYENESKITIIEVKSGKNYNRHSALNNILGTKNYKIDKVIVLSNKNVILDEKIIYYPIYMTMFL